MKKTAFISGGSRGIGRSIALKLAENGYNIAVIGKTDTPHPKLEGTIHEVVEAVKAIGGNAIAIKADIREEEMVKNAVEKTIETFGSIDVLINCASAINLTDIDETEMKRYDLMFDINVRGTFMVSKYCLPYLRKGQNPHIINMSPPLPIENFWYGRHLAYTMSKTAMSLIVVGLADQLKEDGIAVNALWPKTAVSTAAISNKLGNSLTEHSRTTEIMSDAAWAIISQNSREVTGKFFIDEDILRSQGETNFDKYAINPSKELAPDLFI